MHGGLRESHDGFLGALHVCVVINSPRESPAMSRLPAILVLISMFGSARADTLTLTDRMHHLRQSGTREWAEFPEQPEAASLATTFTVGKPAKNYCLRIRHQDIKERWRVRLNDRDLGTLRIDENDMVVYVPVPEDAVKQGENNLTVDCPKSKAADDIRIGEIQLIDRPRDEVLRQSTLIVRVFEGLRSWGSGTRTDDATPSLPVRITVLDEADTLRDTGAESDATLPSPRARIASLPDAVLSTRSIRRSSPSPLATRKRSIFPSDGKSPPTAGSPATLMSTR
jgi:hypothetical protein